MRKLITGLGSFLLVLTLSRCATGKTYTIDTLPAERLLFRYGGGFTGQSQEYMLLPNGQLFYRREVINELPFREVAPVDPKVAKDLFDTYEKQDFAALTYDDPGNMTYTITRVDGAATTQMSWGGEQQKPKETVLSYWRRAMQAFDGKASVEGGKQ